MYKAVAAQEAGLDPLNDFAPDEEGRAAEIHQQWVAANFPVNFAAFLASTTPQPPTGANEDGGAVAPAPDTLTQALSTKFGLASEAIEGYTKAMVERASRKKEGQSKASRPLRTKPLTGKALAAVTQVIEDSLKELSRTAREYEVDPSTAMQLFSKVLTYFSGDVWNAYQLAHGLRRAKQAQGMFMC